MKSSASTVATAPSCVGRSAPPMQYSVVADGGDHLAVNRGVDRRQRGPFAVGDVVHLDGGQHARRFLAADGDDPAVDERGAVAPARSRHVRQVVPRSRCRIEPLERRRVLVGGQVPSADRVHVDAVRHRGQMFARRWQVGGLRPRLAVEHLGRLDELLVVLPADDDELVTDDRCRRRGPRMSEVAAVLPTCRCGTRKPCSTRPRGCRWRRR